MAALTALPQDDASNKVRVGLTAGEETWISVSTDGKQVYAGLLQPNQTKLLEGSGKVKILIGNAGGLEISLNGKTLGTVGSRGARWSESRK
jgi:arginine/ornithine N-succinyltransferase beta subunit